jgi:hypothetical protein
LHGVVFWFFHAPVRGARSTTMQWRSPRPDVAVRYLGDKPRSVAAASARPALPTPPASAPEPEPLQAERTDTPAALDETANTGSVGQVAPVDYLPIALLDVEPVVVQDIPTDPPELIGRTETGAIILTLLIGASGVVDDLVIESSDLPDIFVQVARRDFLGVRFSPGVRNGQAVPSTMRIELTVGSTSQP